MPLEEPAIVRRLKPGNDNRPEPAPARSGEMPAIVTTVSRKRVTLLRAERASADGDGDPELRAWLDRAKWGYGLPR